MKEAKTALSSLKPSEDMARIAQLVMKEANSSLPNAGRILGKVAAVALVGFTITSSCCSSQYLVPVGVIILAMAAGWLDAIGNECSCQRFFPSKSLNSIGSSLFRWQWVVFWTCIIFSLSFIQSGATVGLSQLTMNERLWLVSVMAGVPLMLMLLCRSVEPFRFNRARADIKRAEILVRQLAAKHCDSDVNTVAPLIEPESVPLYRLGSVAKVLYDIAATYDAKDKMNVDLTQSQTSSGRWSVLSLFSIVYAPFRTIANNLLLWESEDIMLYAVIAVYYFAVYLGSEYLPWAPMVPFCLLAPLLGPKSRAGRCLRSLQEDIRLAQGRVAEKKGGMEPDPVVEDWKCTINWPMVVYIGGSHLAALYALVVLVFFGGKCPIFATEPVKGVQLYMFIVIYICSGWGITAGAHRLWAHNSYKAGLPLRFVLMIFNSIANQGTIFHWARDHRLHHKYSDTIADPHDANRGFWFSHVGWLLVKKNPAVIKVGRTVNIEDLKKDGLVMFQKKADPFWNLMWCFAFPAFTSLLLGDTLWNGFLFCGVLRYCAVLNATWAVNSVVHAFGNRPYNPSHATTENGWVSLFALGEGWHNWHHAFAWDYATSELGALFQFNPTKVFIDVMAFLGLAWDRKRAHGVWASRKKRWEQEQGRPVVESLEGPPLFKHRVISFGPELYGPDNQPEPVDMKKVEQ